MPQFFIKYLSALMGQVFLDIPQTREGSGLDGLGEVLVAAGP